MQCPCCREEIKDGAIKCKHCKSSIGASSDSDKDIVVKFIADTSKISKIRILALVLVIIGTMLTIYFIDIERFHFMIGAVIITVIMLCLLCSTCIKKENGVFIFDKEVIVSLPFQVTSMMCFDIDKIKSISDTIPLYIEIDFENIIDVQSKEKNIFTGFIEDNLSSTYINEFLDADHSRIIIKETFFTSEQINGMRSAIRERISNIEES